MHADLTRPWLCPVDRERIAFVSAFPPCDHLAVSGARWFKGKGLRRLAVSVEMFATAAEFCEWAGAPYMIENPVSNIVPLAQGRSHVQPGALHRLGAGGQLHQENLPGQRLCDAHGVQGGGSGEPDDRIHASAGTRAAQHQERHACRLCPCGVRGEFGGRLELVAA